MLKAINSILGTAIPDQHLQNMGQESGGGGIKYCYVYGFGYFLLGFK